MFFFRTIVKMKKNTTQKRDHVDTCAKMESYNLDVYRESLQLYEKSCFNEIGNKK